MYTYVFWSLLQKININFLLTLSCFRLCSFFVPSHFYVFLQVLRV